MTHAVDHLQRSDFPLVPLTNNQLVILGEVVLGDLQVKRCRAPPYTARDVVVRAVARAEPASVVSSLADWDATKMCANA